jgi:hypothetical protein
MSLLGMFSIQDIREKLERYAAEAGLTPNTVCKKATGNFRLLSRMEGRARQLSEDVRRLERFMEDNPVSGGPAKGEGS